LEYKLNKIDTEIRTTINEQTAEGKIHSKRSVELNSENLRERMHRENNKQKYKKKEPFSISKYVKGKKTIEVRAYKSESIEIQVEKEEERSENSNKGIFIDIRR
jgi:hypothetical protein